MQQNSTISNTDINLDWNSIHSVFLDMDGTLLDLNFDNHFWREHVPQRYAERNGISIDAAKAELFPRFKKIEGTMDWYCVDYWSRELDLDIALLKHEVDHLIAVFPYVLKFMDAMKNLGKRTVLVTNAHSKSLELKMNKTRLGEYLDNIISSHDFGLPKENHHFWRRLQDKEPFVPAQTLLIDDSLSVLRSAREYGIAHLLAVYQPDSQEPKRNVGDFRAIHSFHDILPAT